MKNNLYPSGFSNSKTQFHIAVDDNSIFVNFGTVRSEMEKKAISIAQQKLVEWDLEKHVTLTDVSFLHFDVQTGHLAVDVGTESSSKFYAVVNSSEVKGAELYVKNINHRNVVELTFDKAQAKTFNFEDVHTLICENEDFFPVVVE